MHFFLSGVAVIVQRHGPLQYVRINYKAVKSYVWHWHCIQQKKLVKKDWCNTGKPSETKQHHQKRAARHTSPSQKCVSPSQDTENNSKRGRDPTQHKTPQWTANHNLSKLGNSDSSHCRRHKKKSTDKVDPQCFNGHGQSPLSTASTRNDQEGEG